MITLTTKQAEDYRDTVMSLWREADYWVEVLSNNPFAEKQALSDYKKLQKTCKRRVAWLDKKLEAVYGIR